MGPTTETTTAQIPVAAMSNRARWRVILTPRVVAEESSWASSGSSRAHQMPMARNGAKATSRGTMTSMRTNPVDPASHVCASAARWIWALRIKYATMA